MTPDDPSLEQMGEEVGQAIVSVINTLMEVMDRRFDAVEKRLDALEEQVR